MKKVTCIICALLFISANAIAKQSTKDISIPRERPVPRLNLPQEQRVTIQSLKGIPSDSTSIPKSTTTKKLTHPSTITFNANEWKTETAKSFQSKKQNLIFSLDDIAIKDVTPTVGESAEVQEKEITTWKEPQDIKLQAFIFLEKQKDYAMALSLLKKLATFPEYQTEAHYYLGVASRNLGLIHEFEHQMLLVLKEKNKDFSSKALEELLQYDDLEKDSLQATLLPYLELWSLSPLAQAQGHYLAGQFELNKHHLKKSISHFSQVLIISPHYDEAQYLKALAHYELGEIDEAIRQEQVLLDDLSIKAPQSNLYSHVAINLARKLFQKGSYHDAYQTYLRVSPESPFWIHALQEQAWGQLLSEDYAGAAGNMYSLHTPFFERAYKPESYVIRSIGYLSLCQYGDALAGVKKFKAIYSPMTKKIQDYRKAQDKNMDNYYVTIKKFLKYQKQTEVDGLPDEVLIEIARHPEFIKIQKSINSIEDEWNLWMDISKKLIEHERELTAQMSSLQKEINKATSEMRKHEGQGNKQESLKLELSNLEDLYEAKKQTQQIAIDSRKSVGEFRQESIARLSQIKENAKHEAAKVLARNLKYIDEDLNHLFGQIELVSYEIFSGAGQHLRYQMAGGKLVQHDEDTLAPESNPLEWKFHGEFWIDEIGHYRSSLKNVCPATENKKTAQL